jgi:hypothetical protein
LVEITRQCVDLEPTLGDVMSGLAPLTRFAWEFRYPGETELPTVEMACGWTVRVREVLEAVERTIPPVGPL